MGLCNSDYVIVNGVKMSMADFKKLVKEKKSKTKAKKQKKVLTDINLLPSDIKEMMKKVKLIKSLSAYYDNGYRQWGTIAKRIINLDGIRKPFVLYRAKVREMQQTMNDIAEIAKNDEKAVYQYVRKLSYQLDDIRTQIDLLFKGVSESGIIYCYKDHECINGSGRRLGLQTLMSRSLGATIELNDIIKRCQKISDKGVDAFDYTQETYNGMINAFSKKM